MSTGDAVASALRKESTMRVALHQLESFAHTLRHYAVIEIAEMWNLSPEKIRNLFEHEPGRADNRLGTFRTKRRYATLRYSPVGG